MALTQFTLPSASFEQTTTKQDRSYLVSYRQGLNAAVLHCISGSVGYLIACVAASADIMQINALLLQRSSWTWDIRIDSSKNFFCVILCNESMLWLLFGALEAELNTTIITKKYPQMQVCNFMRLLPNMHANFSCTGILESLSELQHFHPMFTITTSM